MSPLDLTETEPRPDCRVIQVEGELDLSVAFQLVRRLEDAADVATVLVDLKHCAFVDSTGLAAFVQAQQVMERAHTRFAIVGANDRVFRVLEMTGLSSKGLLFEDVEGALSGLPAAKSPK